MEKLDEVIFYVLEKSIKSYRQFAQRNIDRSGLNITIDQWLVLKLLTDYPGMKQAEIAGKVFKDAASITRIIDLLAEKKYITRKVDKNDRRKSVLTLSAAGSKIVKQAQLIVNNNRKKALEGIKPEELEQAQAVLQKIIDRCEDH